MGITWNDGPFKKKVVAAGMDGLEEFALAVWLPQAKANCPVDTATMRNSLGYERDDKNRCVYVGGGGAAKDYIFKQEMDASLRHPTGKSGFIRGAVTDNASKLPGYVKKHIG